MSRHYFFLSLLVAAAFATGAETLVVSRIGRQLAAERRRLARLEAQAQTIRGQQADNAAAQKAADEKLAALQISATAKEARSAQAIAWRNRIKALQQRLDSLPEEKIPELKLLGMKDWIDAVLYADTATDAQIQKVLAGLRSRARVRFAAMLPAALSRFAEDSASELPEDILDLLPYLTPPADAEMLSHYTLKRSGKIGARDEELLTSQLPDNGGVISVSPSGYGFKAHPDDTEIAAGAGAGDDLIDSIGLETLGSDEGLGMKDWTASIAALGPAMEQAFTPFDDAFGDRLKAAVKQYSAAHAGEPPSDVSQLRGYLADCDQLAERMRLVTAQAAYIMDHGKPADSPGQMQRYLDRPVDPTHTLRSLKLTVEGEQVSMDFSL